MFTARVNEIRTTKPQEKKKNITKVMQVIYCWNLCLQFTDDTKMMKLSFICRKECTCQLFNLILYLNSM